MKVRDVMTQPVETCWVDTNLASASRHMEHADCGTLAVLDRRGRLAGILTDRDLAIAIGCTSREPARVAVDKAMTHHVHTCQSDDGLPTALARMAEAKVRRLPVVTAEGQVEGIVSIDDIILWGVGPHGVGLHELTAALRVICTRRRIVAEEELPVF